MSRRVNLQLRGACLLVGCAFVLGGAGQAVAQTHYYDPGLYVPDHYVYVAAGATPYSAATHAEADFLRAIGDLQVDTAIARRHHAAAYEHELKNDKERVDWFYSKKLLHRYYRDLLHPSLTDRQTKQYELTKRRVTTLYQALLKNQFTEELNWLALEVARLQPSLVAGAADAFDQAKLDSYHLAHIWLTDRPSNNSLGLVCLASDGKALAMDWPFLLSGTEFDDVRERFESERAAALDELKLAGILAHARQESLRAAWQSLDARFDELYRQQLRTRPIDTPDYVRASRFLKGLKSQVRALAETKNSSWADGSFRFDGDRLTELIDHMHRYGLRFAEPQNDDRGTYRYLFLELLDLYMVHAGPNDYTG